jgi:leucyl aminopeptidase
MTVPHGFAAAPGVNPRPLYLVDRDGLEGWRQRQPQPMAQWLAAHGFDASPGSMLALPGGDGSLAGAVLGIGDPLDPYSYAHAPHALPGGDWQVVGDLDATARNALQLGWGLGSYRYTRYRDPPRASRSTPCARCASRSTPSARTWPMISAACAG